ncbi:hypothetical protein [Lacihabitans sp. CS3-21]|uniref:hypothetical protein n=1 Tax=Lacihabitans sp. CS3-21 TaxID=2487332 RepID=UPI0020CF944C|nr:hypothetical protein [Lacihabitans sp. CS3-21]MCP9747381.1 hypothetical protein [Lacihabitans sp. CS3-21]
MQTSKGKPKVSSTSGEFISLDEAVAKQKKHLDLRKRVFKDEDPVRSQFFGKDHLLEILKNEDCVGIKIIFGMEDENMPNLVLIGADENLKNIAKDSTGLKDPNRPYLSNGPGCPNICN